MNRAAYEFMPKIKDIAINYNEKIRIRLGNFSNPTNSISSPLLAIASILCFKIYQMKSCKLLEQWRRRGGGVLPPGNVKKLL